MAAPLGRTNSIAQVQMNITPTVDWSWLETMEFSSGSSNGNSTIWLPGTHIGFVTSTEGGSIESRMNFVVHVVEDAIKNCPKDKDLALVSLGANCLLMEYLIGRGLLQNGFKNVFFYPIDPNFRFSNNGRERTEQELEQLFTPLNQQFHDQINAIYKKRYQKPLPEHRIQPLTKAQNLEKHFPSGANVILIECMPPYHLNQYAIKKHNMPELSSEQMFTGSHYVSPKHANSISLLPKEFAQQYEEIGALTLNGLPFVQFENPVTSSQSCLEWGCKIYADGKYLVNFIGGKDYQALEGLPSDNRFGELETTLKDLLQRKIEMIKGGNPNKKLTQEEQSEVLLEVANKISSLHPEWKIFYTRDYTADRSELVSFLSDKASDRYRKAFSLTSDPYTDYKITESAI